MDEAKRRYLDLLAERATQGLDPAKQQELRALVMRRPEWSEASFELVAAAVDLATMGALEPMPAAIRRKLVRMGVAWCREAAAGT